MPGSSVAIGPLPNFPYKLSSAQGDTTEVSTLHGERNAGCLSWIRKERGAQTIAGY